MDDFDIPQLPSMQKGEVVLLSCPTEYKNQPGKLLLTTERILWCEEKGAPAVGIAFPDIKSTLVSNATSKRVCIKLVTQHEPLGHIFYFPSSNARNEMNDFKDALCRARDGNEKEKTREHVSHRKTTPPPSSTPVTPPSYSPPTNNFVPTNKGPPPAETKEVQHTKGPMFEDVVEDFFSIKEDNKAPLKANRAKNTPLYPSITATAATSPAATTTVIEQYGSNGASVFEITVRDPQKIADSSQSYVTYEVVAKQYKNKSIAERRRYKDFEWLYNRLVQDFQHRVVIPALPAKSLLNISTPDFTTKRCKDLDKFLKQVVRNPILRSSHYLQTFLEGSIEHESGVAAILGSLENHIGKLTGPTVIVDDESGSYSDVEVDYRYVRGLMAEWKLTPKKLPFEKFLVVILGTTSAGKSAFVNHFLGLQVKRSAVGQMDTHFSLVETLPRDKFAQYSDKEGVPFPEFTDEQLAKRISGDVHSDPRYGYVFMYLDTPMTLARHEPQFINYAHYISSYGLVRSIIVNEHYLRGDPELVQHAKRTILLDSPGFDPGKEHDHAEKFIGNLKILQFFCSMSDLSLFMIPATQMNMVADKVLQELLATSPQSGPTLLPSIAGSPENKSVEYKGTVVWDKMRFVISKIDEVYENNAIGVNLNEQYFELGRLLGKNLMYLEPPTFAQCLAIALPEHQHSSKPHTGDLVSLLQLVRSLNSESSYMSRLEHSIQTMCLDLQSAIKASWSNWISPKQWMSSDINLLQDIYRRSCGRLKKMNAAPKQTFSSGNEP